MEKKLELDLSNSDMMNVVFVNSILASQQDTAVRISPKLWRQMGRPIEVMVTITEIEE